MASGYYRDVEVDAVADLYDSMSKSLLVFFARRTYDGEIALDLTAGDLRHARL
jgi:hypothetical protein